MARARWRDDGLLRRVEPVLKNLLIFWISEFLKEIVENMHENITIRICRHAPPNSVLRRIIEDRAYSAIGTVGATKTKGLPFHIRRRTTSAGSRMFND